MDFYGTPMKNIGTGCGRSLVLKIGNLKQADISIAKFGREIREVGGAHITARPNGQQNHWIGKGLYFREAYMKNRTTYIDANLLVSPSSITTDEKVRVFQRKLYIRAKQDNKGRKAHKLLRQHPYNTFVKGKGLLDLEKYARLKTLANCKAIMNTFKIGYL
jgi:hypothetical protein